MRDPNRTCLFCNMSNYDYELENDLADALANRGIEELI